MTSLAYIAWRYVIYHKGRSLTLIAIIALCTFLPTTLNVLMRAAEVRMTARADGTPLLIGAKGSDLDLVMNALYFHRATTDPIRFSESDKVDASGLAYTVPIYAKFRARNFPIVGTSLDYFEFRKLKLANGRAFGLLGEAVVGARVASALSLAPGSALLSTPEALFDIAGVYPLKMKIVGVLEPHGTPDDLAVFVDVRTAWVIEGLGHGHQDLAKSTDSSVILKRAGKAVIANAKLKNYAEIRPENVDKFHFHGNSGAFPLSAILVVANDERAEAILRGRYEGSGHTVQAIKPAMVINGLLQEIFQIKRLLDGILILVGIAVCLALALVFSLSLRLRKQEMAVNRRIGASRFVGALLIGAEIIILATFGVASGLLAAAIVATQTQDIAQRLIVG